MEKRAGKIGYHEALTTLSKNLKESQKEVAHYFLEKHTEIMEKELEAQRQWEKKLLEDDRLATERMMTNLMSSFFQNLRNVSLPQPPQFPFFNPPQVSTPQISIPIPYPSPTSPTGIVFPSFPTAANQSLIAQSEPDELNIPDSNPNPK